jgi:hypothetical protein
MGNDLISLQRGKWDALAARPIRPKRSARLNAATKTLPFVPKRRLEKNQEVEQHRSVLYAAFRIRTFSEAIIAPLAAAAERLWTPRTRNSEAR